MNEKIAWKCHTRWKFSLFIASVGITSIIWVIFQCLVLMFRSSHVINKANCSNAPSHWKTKILVHNLAAFGVFPSWKTENRAQFNPAPLPRGPGVSAAFRQWLTAAVMPEISSNSFDQRVCLLVWTWGYLPCFFTLWSPSATRERIQQ